ncbi:peptidylprolyl isomerase fpr3 [Emydomyces testavorans]|uniref:FK506-binding protein n=1 Tax=Emydomyces testavorans TaxID=2070801 RepID=A0AAF0IIF6_9EURO|nr:peptidylprolyl isomerase fpr3 [Emydomyces testavorans]
MSGTQPVALYAARVPPGGILVPAVPNASAMFRVTMAAIDPDAMPEYEDEANPNKPLRATLKIVRPPPGLDLDEDEDEDDIDEEDESSDDEANGGPSDPTKAKLAKQAAKLKEMEDAMAEDEDDTEDDDVDLKAAISKLIKGKDKATDDEVSESSDGLELEEVVLCTLDPERNYQQTLDFVVAEDERIFFKVTGTHTVYLTGNYVIPLDGPGEDESDEEDYDDYDQLSLDEDELAMMEEDEEESDDLDDMANPRIMEIDTDEEKDLSKSSKKGGKGKNKRPAEDSDENLDDMMSKSMKPAEPVTNGEPHLSKKQQKKLKKNNGEAAEAKQEPTEPKQSPTTAKSDKKVQFAKKLEQGPTGSAQQKTESGKAEGTTGVLGVKEVQGVRIEDRKLGKGPAAKKGDRVSMRYIGKLENGNVFDSNKKGKPFSFKIGVGEVIKGWDIGIPGMAVGAERRIIVPPHLAYGKSAQAGIPANSKLTFDVKLLEIK